MFAGGNTRLGGSVWAGSASFGMRREYAVSDAMLRERL